MPQQLQDSVKRLEDPVKRLGHWREQTPDKVFLRQPVDNNWQEWTFEETWQQVARLANSLGDLPARSHVAIYSLNCAHWFIADLAILMAGHISVPIYPTAGENTISYVLQHCDVKRVFIGKLFDWQSKQHCFKQVDSVSIFNRKQDLPYIDDVIAKNKTIPKIYVPSMQEVATIIYTSGTTGVPKGVMLTFRSIGNALATVEKVFEVKPEDRFFSYLPLAHIAERMAVEMGSVYFGSSVSFVQSLDHFADNLRSVKPTIFFAVPRIWMKLKDGIESKLGGAWLVAKLFKTPIVGAWLKRTLRKLLGLDQTRLALSAAASLPQLILDWFEELNIEICEAYGLSETAGFSHINLPGRRKSGTVGQPYPGADCIIADNGEVLLRNASLMEGYYKEPDLSASVIQDGWFRTGDLGRVDEENFLTITGRVKELFKTSKGKYISPVPIENKLSPLLDVEHLCVMGANLPQPIAIAVVLDELTVEFKKQFESKGKQTINEINSQLEKHERIKALVVVSEDWTTENELMTPTMKIRRQQIEEKYQALLYEYQNTNKLIIWECL